MKKYIRLFILTSLIAALLPLKVGSIGEELKEDGLISENPTKKDMRGIWVATVLNIDYPTKPTADSEILKEEAIKILDDAEKLGMNAVFLQVRPSGDAFYKSEYYPWSRYLTGEQGLEPDDGFDPLEFWVSEAHKRNIELHAWINPYRVTKKSFGEPNHNFSALHLSNPAVKNPGWVVKHSDGNLYFNPGIPEVRNYIIKGVLEIINNYDVDGMHMDDYFYPGRDFDDEDTYKYFGNGGFGNINEWRRECVNLLVQMLSEKIKANSEHISFGISPFGIWANKSSNFLGSDTRGAQSYYDHYADTRKWVKDGIIDYIAPQIYWHICYEIADYEKLINWWADVAKDTDVDLYIGQAAYKIQNEDPKKPWYGAGETEKQLRLNEAIPEIKGSIFYNYNSVEKCPELFLMLQDYYKQKDEDNENIVYYDYLHKNK